MATEKFANNASTTLNGAILDTSQSLVITSASGFPTNPQFRIKIDNEILLVTGVSGTTYTVSRAQEETSGVGHADGATVTHILTAGALTQYQLDTLALFGAGVNLLPHVPILSGVEVETLNGWMTIGSISFNPSNYSYTQVELEVLLSTSDATHAAKARLWNDTTNAQIGTDLSSTSLTVERLTQIITPTSGLNIYEVQIQTTSSGSEANCYGARLNLSGGTGMIPAPTTLVPITADTLRSSGVNETLVVGTLTTAITITLPASPTTGQTIKIKDSGGTVGTYNVTVSGNGKNLDGSSTFVMVQAYSGYEFTYNGTSWMVF